jgi:hypothetical protein
MYISVLEVQNNDELIKRMKRRTLIERRADDPKDTVLETRIRGS